MARKRKDDNASLYKTYITDALRAAYDLNMRYADLVIRPVVYESKPSETGEEIIERISKKIERLL